MVGGSDNGVALRGDALLQETGRVWETEGTRAEITGCRGIRNK